MLLAAALVSCEKPSFESSTDIEIIPEAGYIRFSTGVATKAPIIQNLREKSFGVLGYNYGYSTRWDVARPLATPEIFYNLPVACATNGVCTYDLNASQEGNQLEPWSLTKMYSFFAYYPMADVNNGVSISAQSAVNMPTVTYNLPLVGNANGAEVNPDDLIDLMTAYAIDKTAGDGNVGFTFQHRLFCIEVLAQNFNTQNTRKDANGNPVKDADGKDVMIDADETISNLKLTIDNIAYKGVTVPMMKGDSEPVKVANDKGAVDFRLLSSTESVLVRSHDEGSSAVSLSGTDGSNIVMLVPQTAAAAEGGKLEGSLTFNLTNSAGDSQTVTGDFSSDIDFQEGKKYTIMVSFTGDTIVIALAESGSWEPYSVNYEFE